MNKLIEIHSLKMNKHPLDGRFHAVSVLLI